MAACRRLRAGGASTVPGARPPKGARLLFKTPASSLSRPGSFAMAGQVDFRAQKRQRERGRVLQLARRMPMLPNALKIVVAGAALIAVANRGGAADEKMQEKMVLLPSAVKWGDPPPTLPKGTKLTVLTGDPSQPGAFVLRVYFPANTLVAPHTHKTAENLTVISGELYHQMGEKLDRNCGDQMKQGAFVYLPAMMPQSVWTKDENAVVQVTGTGPFGLDYINPAEPICVIRCAASLNGATDHHM